MSTRPSISRQYPQVVRTPALLRARNAVAHSLLPSEGEYWRIGQMLQELARLSRDRHIHVRFDDYTGLVRTLRGDLMPDRGATNEDEMVSLANEFLHEYQVALVGDRTDWEPDRPSKDLDDQSPVIGAVARFRQTSRDGIPVFKGTLQCSFGDSGQLTMITSSWTPLPPGQSWEDWFHQLSGRDDEDYAKEIARDYVSLRLQAQEIKIEAAPYSRNSRVIVPFWPSVGFPLGTPRPEPSGATFRPRWAFWISDLATNRGWSVFVDTENREVVAKELPVRSPMDLCVYKTNQDAQANQRTTVSLEVPGGPPLSSGQDFALSGNAFREPGPCGNMGVSDDALSTGNLYYHLCQARDVFKNHVVPQAWPTGIGNPTKVPGDKDVFPVELLNQAITEYDPQSHHLRFGRVGEAKKHTLDRDVVSHEYAHSLFHRVQPDLFLGGRFADAINEGMAFYFASSLSASSTLGAHARVTWGEVAFGDPIWTTLGFRDLQRPNLFNQQANFDFLEIFDVFPQYAALSDPAGDEYACGMVWARTLWDLRRSLGHELADAIILRGLNMVGGRQNDLETLAEAILHYELERADLGPRHESALRLMFCSRGIAADSPIHDLYRLEWNGAEHILAATEGGGTNDSGCRISSNSGVSWSALGNGGPAEVVALTGIAVDRPNQAGVPEKVMVVFAGGEVWEGPEMTPQSGVFSYTLPAGPVDLGLGWTALPDLPDPTVGLLCLLALPGSNSRDYHLVAGTEQGLLIYKSATNSWIDYSNIIGTDSTLCLASVDNQNACWLVATAWRVFSI